MNSTSTANIGFTKRNEISTGKVVDMYGPLHCDLFNVDKYLINGVEMTIKLQRARDEFCLMGSANTSGKIKILEAVFYARKVNFASSTLLAHHKALNIASI